MNEFLRVAGAEIGVVEKMPQRLEFAARHHSPTRYYPSHDEARQEDPNEAGVVKAVVDWSF